MFISTRNSSWPRSDVSIKSRLDVTPGAALLYPILYYLDTGGWFAAVLPAVVFHEAGHWLALHICGARVFSLRLDTAGLCMEASPLSSASEEAWCAAAGPLLGLAWICPALLAGGEWGMKSAWAALWVNLFNLLPALPLDGGRILYALTGNKAAIDFLGAVTSAVLAVTAAVTHKIQWLFPCAYLIASAFRSE